MACYEVELPDGSSYWTATDKTPIEIAADAATRAGLSAEDTLPIVRLAGEIAVTHG